MYVNLQPEKLCLVHSLQVASEAQPLRLWPVSMEVHMENCRLGLSSSPLTFYMYTHPPTFLTHAQMYAHTNACTNTQVYTYLLQRLLKSPVLCLCLSKLFLSPFLVFLHLLHLLLEAKKGWSEGGREERGR